MCPGPSGSLRLRAEVGRSRGTGPRVCPQALPEQARLGDAFLSSVAGTWPLPWSQAHRHTCPHFLRARLTVVLPLHEGRSSWTGP